MKDIDYVNRANGKLRGERVFMTGKLKFNGSMIAAFNGLGNL